MEFHKFSNNSSIFQIILIDSENNPLVFKRVIFWKKPKLAFI